MDESHLECAAERVARRLIPNLEAHLHNCLQSGEAYLEGYPGRAVENYERARAADPAMGWALGVLSEAISAGLLLARHEQRGLEWVARAMLSDSQTAQSIGACLPDLSPIPGTAWKASFLFAWLCSHIPNGETLRWKYAAEADRVVLEVALAGPHEKAQVTLAGASARVPNSIGAATCWGQLQLPGDWLATHPAQTKG